MTGRGESGGAATIVNAMATGRGVAFGLAWSVRARIEPAAAWRVVSNGRRLPSREARLARRSAELILREASRPRPLEIRIECEIPSRRGLKSSSAVSVAVARAALQHVGARERAQEVLEAAAQAGLESKTSLTGAFDDAAACLLGGVVFTDNARRRILRRSRLPPGLAALVNVPRGQLATGSLRRVRFDGIEPLVHEAWKLARAGRTRDAMVLNTAAYAPLFNHRPSFTLAALERGAWAAGLSGKGPAEVALVRGARPTRIARGFPLVRRVAVRPGGRAP